MKYCYYFVLAVVLASAPGLSIHAKNRPFETEGAHRMVEVIYLGSRAELTDGEGRWIYEWLLSQGIEDSDIRDGSVAVGRMYCCRTDGNDPWFAFYAPPDLQLRLGDYVEIVLTASRPERNEVVYPSRAVRIRGNVSDSRSCHWSPQIEGNWLRVVYCDWMEEEGWVYARGLFKTWYKPAH